MKLLQSKIFIVLLSGLLLVSCKEDSKTDPDTPAPITSAPDDLPPTDTSTPNLTITWEETAVKVSHDVYSAEYGRAHRVKGDTVLLTYHYGPLGNEWDNIAIRRSIDGGENWSTAETLMADDNPNYYGFSNPELITLQNGDVLLAYTGRGRPDDNAHANIQIRVSKDRGWTFGPPQIVTTGRSWEPAMIQLPDGEIELFYSSEAKWWSGPGDTAEQQEILMVRSTDNGATWSYPVQVAYTSGMRDGMAVPLVLQNGKGMVFPVESVNNTASPWILWSSMEARWDYAGVGTIQNERRWLATRAPIWGGAPFIIQLPSGQTVLSVQDRGGRTIGSDWKKNTMLVLVGNSVAKNFSNISYPWPGLPVNEGAYYSSLFLKDPQTLVIITTRNYANGHSEVYWKEGHIQ
ncbi:sialidase family protein [Pontibacter akesuensis]|uniref:BNR repeat-like domain-containing protein n=1 Tax=Pontibacter akesuensis TaxID=388950 RepID=A0A1I7JD58_9BACT|nr:sialidase family protein [Pontibacter akesuensis]GHA70799.1 hypothetical protein GCM10007389_25290 [Pontibacter akesuensis]SFU83112.1 BNR repeat-like domain-containing protein [Pontibacter akesuensis]